MRVVFSSSIFISPIIICLSYHNLVSSYCQGNPLVRMDNLFLSIDKRFKKMTTLPNEKGGIAISYIIGRYL